MARTGGFEAGRDKVREGVRRSGTMRLQGQSIDVRNNKIDLLNYGNTMSYKSYP